MTPFTRLPRLLVTTLFAAAALGTSGAALAQDVAWSVSIGSNGQASVTLGNLPFVFVGPGYPPPPPVYQPAPAYWPAPVVLPPPVVVLPPRPAHVYATPPVYLPPRVVIQPPARAYGPGHRHWHFERDRHDRDHRHPPRAQRQHDWQRHDRGPAHRGGPTGRWQ